MASDGQGKRLASGGDNKKGDINGVVKVWDLLEGSSSHTCIFTYKTHEKEVRAVALTQDGSRLASGAKEAILNLIRIRNPPDT